jgi:response regulator RpfG family c-di-GMP phosphodiesterase
MSHAVLFVDDEVNILNSLQRLFDDTPFQTLTALNAADAVEMLKNNEVSVIVSDNRMPKMTGVEFLQKAKEISPDSVRILLTGYADMQAAIDAINKGEVYKFITKPWDDEELKEIVSNAASRYNIVSSLKRADRSAILSLAQTIELKDSYTKGHCDRVGEYSLSIAEGLELPKEMQTHIMYGSWLHDCGKIGVPEAILNFGGSLSNEQMDIIKKHPQWGADVARLARFSPAVVNIILHHHERYDGTGYPFGLKGDKIPVEARIAAVADTYDALTSARPYRTAFSSEKAMEIMIRSKGSHLDPDIVDMFIKVLGAGKK